jgi:hypothetical protein
VSPAGEAGTVPAATTCGIGELDRARVHVERAVAELKAARQAWGVWADGIRQQAEERLGVTGQRVLGDLEYARALEVGAAYIAAVNAAGAALEAGGRGGGNGAAGGAVRDGVPALPDRCM